MNKKILMTGACSAALVFGLATSAFAQDGQNGWDIMFMDPDPDVHTTIEHTVQSTNPTDDFGAVRSNDILDSNNGFSGIATDQQNNGSENAIGATTNVLVNVGGGDNLDQNLGIVQTVTQGDVDGTSGTGSRDNNITGSYNGASGITNAQQNNGDGNGLAIGNVVSANLDDDDSTGDLTQDVLIQHTVATAPGFVQTSSGVRHNTIEDSYGDAAGIMNVQQNNGDNNALAIGNAVSANINSDDGTGDSAQQLLIDHGVANSSVNDDADPNGVPAVDAERVNTVTGSFTGASGIANVQQNNGGVNTMAIGNAVSANIGGGDIHDESTQKVLVRGNLNNNDTRDDNAIGAGNVVVGERVNNVDGSFGDYQGIANVQQNNGSTNAMGIGNAVVVDVDTGNRPGSEHSRFTSVRAVGIVTNNSVDSTSAPGPSAAPFDRQNDVTGSFTGYQGMANGQQNNGDSNSLSIANGVRASINSDDVDNTSGDNVISAGAFGTVSNNPGRIGVNVDNDQNRGNTITDSFGGSAGVTNWQQNNGDNNAINSANAIVANINDGDRSQTGADIHTGAQSRAIVTDNRAFITDDVDRVNTITGSFNDASGIATVQQNNGDQNVLNSANAVVVSIDSNSANGFNGDIMSDTALSATVSGNVTIVAFTDVPPGFSNTIIDSFNGFSGIKTTQQNNGNHNAIQSSVSVVANLNN